MATSQQMLAALGGMQANAQAALPVIPNNGNPNGAYNMPQTAGVPRQAAPAGPDLSWLQPSKYMDEVNNILQQIQSSIDTSQPVVPQATAPAITPVLPTLR